MASKTRPKVSVKQSRVLRYDDKKVLQSCIIGPFSRTDADSWPTVLGMIKHLSYRRIAGPETVQAKFKKITEPLIKEMIIHTPTQRMMVK